MTTPGYPHFHKDRVNLTVHIVMAPVFVAGVLGAVWSAGLGQPGWMSAFVTLPMLSLAAQGFSHRREPNPPLPFRGPGNFVKRILREQFVTFPSFVWNGRWKQAWLASRAARDRSGPR